MKIRRLIKASLLFMAAGLFAACASEDTAQDKEKGAEKGTEAPKGITFTINEPKVSAKARATAFDAEADAATRATIKHTPGQGADVYWTSGDFIWVQDHNGTWHMSTAIQVNDGGASATFTLPPATYDNGCAVNYTVTDDPFYGRGTTTTIQAQQTQSAPDNFNHAGSSGDCAQGVAQATGNPDKYNFRLTHMSTYLCFLPRCENAALGQNIRLTQIKVTKTGSGLDQLGALYPITGVGADDWDLRTKTITLNLSAAGFPLTNTATHPETNACYMVIANGQHDLTITYTIKDPSTNVSTDITQTISGNFEQGKIYDITANLSMPHGNHYMWGAKNPYWYGYESYAPLVNRTSDPHWPNPADPSINMNDRYYDNGGTGTSTSPARYDTKEDAYNGMQGVPNANELLWYLKKGDPHWGTGIYERNGHLVASVGMWIRKKNAIVTYLKNHEGYPQTLTWEQMKERYQASATASPTDARVIFKTLGKAPVRGNPSNPADYFFLPAIGYYLSGTLQGMDSGIETGGYWSSSAHPQDAVGTIAYGLIFNKNYISVISDDRPDGFWVQPFE